MQRLSAEKFMQLREINPNITVIDLRTPAEVEKEKLENCHCLPVHEISGEKVLELLKNSGKTTDEPIYLLCQSGKRAEMATQKLADHEGINTVILEGGLNAIKTSGAKTLNSDRGVIPLERQVRITAGLLVLTGVVLSYLVNPSFILLSGFVGAGLVFSGITDTCPMAMGIAKMPWNQASAKTS